MEIKCNYILYYKIWINNIHYKITLTEHCYKSHCVFDIKISHRRKKQTVTVDVYMGLCGVSRVKGWGGEVRATEINLHVMECLVM